ncbi:MAG: 3-phosphoshikimate 1-carboxyvinyltransferase [Candidatus Krumholzibacteria bacterium]|nr:3-phosphoshikimate 1-carboxyvinyltransferase [Candidatus Krumholzibacteria bacterium]
MRVTLTRAQPLRGRVAVPPDKSISHRALILGALSSGLHIENLSPSDDVKATLRCVEALGAEITREEDGSIVVRAGRPRAERAGVMDAGNSGTTARLLAGLCAVRGGACTITGDASLRRRPMARVADPLRRMGARVETTEEGTLPMTVAGGTLQGIEYALPVPSAQVKSAVLIAGLCAAGETRVIEPVPTRDHTERMLEALGEPVARERAGAGASVGVRGVPASEAPRLGAGNVRVPGDFSSAAFFIVAAACIPGSEVRLEGVGVNPTRTGLLTIMREMGASIAIENAREIDGEPVADLVVSATPLRGVAVSDPELIAAAIDEIPVLAVAAVHAEGETVLRGAGELRHKESDRIAVMAANLRALGAAVEEREDGLAIAGGARLRGALVTAAGDHRVAMAMAVAALIANGETAIDDAGVVGVSYPSFFDDLRALARAA